MTTAAKFNTGTWQVKTSNGEKHTYEDSRAQFRDDGRLMIERESYLQTHVVACYAPSKWQYVRFLGDLS